jgi:hypothetical protein
MRLLAFFVAGLRLNAPANWAAKTTRMKKLITLLAPILFYVQQTRKQ